MSTAYDTILDLTAPEFRQRPHADRARRVNDFARELDWRPSEYLEDDFGLGAKCNGHLIIEHGLEHAAVISFLSHSASVNGLGSEEQTAFLAISYNNLVDWHLVIDQGNVGFFFNRAERPRLEVKGVSRSDISAVSARSFEPRVERPPKANLLALDTVLIETIDHWKRFLSAEAKVSNECLSALFNAIIFVRAVEDHNRLTEGNGKQSLLVRWRNDAGGRGALQRVITATLRQYQASAGAMGLLDLRRLSAFDAVDKDDLAQLLSDFYRVKQTPYTYNFALMSRHALSRIYEKYTSLLWQQKLPADAENTLFPIDLPESERNKATGSFYTPQYVARFFCRFLEEQYPPRAFRELKVIDPTCGSGVFLRTVAERRVDRSDLATPEIEACFTNLQGIDVDPNACHAAKLSLALLHLMLTDRLPIPLRINIHEAEFLEYCQRNQSLYGKFGVVVGNPPFVRAELQTTEVRRRIAKALDGLKRGKSDLCFAVLREAMRLVEPGGFICMVLPHTFLIGSAPGALRSELREQFWLRCVVDLSAIRVFGDVDSYVILLIAQRKAGSVQSMPKCRVVLCQDFVGQALQACLENKTVQTSYFSAFDVDQGFFGDEPWVMVDPSHIQLDNHLRGLPVLGDFLIVREGLVTGCDEVFIRAQQDVAVTERHLYLPLLPDKQIGRYLVPKATSKLVFYPYDRDGNPLPETEIKAAKETWKYLSARRGLLAERATAKGGETGWAYLARPRATEMRRPKIVSPHLMLIPRFALDPEGRYAVTRAPFLITKQPTDDLDLLRCFTAVLNSAVAHWYLRTHAYRFAEGYVKLDPAYLRRLPVPSPTAVDPVFFRRIAALVQRRVESGNTEIEEKIDALVLDAYGLSRADRDLLCPKEQQP